MYFILLLLLLLLTKEASSILSTLLHVKKDSCLIPSIYRYCSCLWLCMKNENFIFYGENKTFNTIIFWMFLETNDNHWLKHNILAQCHQIDQLFSAYQRKKARILWMSQLHTFSDNVFFSPKMCQLSTEQWRFFKERFLLESKN